MTTTILLKIFIKRFFLLKFLTELLYIVIATCLINLSCLYQCILACKIHKNTYGHFDSLSRSRVFKFSAVLVPNHGLIYQKQSITTPEIDTQIKTIQTVTCLWTLYGGKTQLI